MSTHHNLRRELERVKNTDSVRLQHESFSTLLQSISEFVSQVKEEKQLVKDIGKLDKRRKVIGKAIKKGEATEEDTAELQEVLELTEEAKSLKNTIDAKQAVLRSLEKEVKALLYAIRK